MKMWNPISAGSPKFSDSEDDEEMQLEESSSQTPGGNDEVNDAVVVGSPSTPDVGINPMLNPVILDGLLGVCQLEDLRRFRLVCKLWLEVSLKRWRKDMIVIIAKPSSSSKAKLNWRNLDLLYNDPDIKTKPFRRFRLKQYEFSKKECVKRSTFLKTCGPWMHHLEIYEPVIRSFPPFYKLIFEQTPNLGSLNLLEMPYFALKDKDIQTLQPNLSVESLSVTISENYDLEDEYMPFVKLMRYFPNIKTLILQSILKEEYEALTEALEELNPQQKGVEGRKLNIIYKNMCTDCISDPESISHKNFIKLPYISLSSLEVELDSSLNDNFLSEVFRFHQRTLKTLDLSRDQAYDIHIPPRNPFQSPQQVLTKLRLKGNVVDNFYFLEDTPNLTLLHFSEIHLRNTLNKTNLQKMESKVRLGNLKMLRILPIRIAESQDFSEAEMKMIVTCMPNVKQFVGPLTNDSFRVVCESWKELKVLHITYSTNPVSDSGITGIDVPWEDECRKPNISDLKYLYKFGTDSPLLSDDSVWNGFLKLDFLQSLKLEFCENTSNEAFSAAFSKFPSVSVTRSSSKYKGKQQLNLDLQTKAAQLLNDFGIK